MVLDWQPCRLRQVARSTARYGRRPREAAADRERLTRRSALLQAGSAAKPAKRTGGTCGVGGGRAGQVLVPLETRPCLGQEVLWVGRSGTRPTTFSRRLCMRGARGVMHNLRENVVGRVPLRPTHS